MTRHQGGVFSPLGHVSRARHVTASLRAAILDGSLEPGAPLREGHLAESFGVSRAPVREALRSLEQEGLVTKAAYRGTFVATSRSVAIDEASSVRLRIEAYAVERSLPALIDDGFTQLEERLQHLIGCARTGDLKAISDAHERFHRAFYENADHQLLLDTWRMIEPVIRLHLPTATWSSEQAELWIRSHRILLDVIRCGDSAAITGVVTEHVNVTDSVPMSGAPDNSEEIPTGGEY